MLLKPTAQRYMKSTSVLTNVCLRQSTVQYNAAQHSTVQYCEVQHGAAQHSTAQYSTFLHKDKQVPRYTECGVQTSCSHWCPLHAWLPAVTYSCLSGHCSSKTKSTALEARSAQEPDLATQAPFPRMFIVATRAFLVAQPCNYNQNGYGFKLCQSKHTCNPGARHLLHAAAGPDTCPWVATCPPQQTAHVHQTSFAVQHKAHKQPL